MPIILVRKDQTDTVHSLLDEVRTVPDATFVFFAPWLSKILEWAEKDQMEEAVDKLFDEVDGWLRAGHLEFCNRLLELPASLFPLKLAVSLLALTKPAAARLPARQAFLQGVRTAIEKGGRDSEVVLGRLYH